MFKKMRGMTFLSLSVMLIVDHRVCSSDCLTLVAVCSHALLAN